MNAKAKRIAKKWRTQFKRDSVTCDGDCGGEFYEWRDPDDGAYQSDLTAVGESSYCQDCLKKISAAEPARVEGAVPDTGPDRQRDGGSGKANGPLPGSSPDLPKSPWKDFFGERKK